MLPVRVSLAVHGKPIVDKFVIVDDSVKLCELVGTALQPLGFGHMAEGAQGFIQIGSWKPLSFEQIADNQGEPAVKLLKPILHNAVLKIVVRQHRSNSSAITRTDLAEIPAVPEESGQVQDASDSTLTDSDTTDDDDGTKSDEVHACDNKIDVEVQVSSPASSSDQALSLEIMLQQFFKNQQPLFDVPASTLTSDGLHELKMSRSPSPDDRPYSPIAGPVKPYFDTIYEVPMLQAWYDVHKFPGKAQCQLYTDELNSLSHRRTSPALSWQTVNNWFKNRRRQDRRKGVLVSATADAYE